MFMTQAHLRTKVNILCSNRSLVIAIKLKAKHKLHTANFFYILQIEILINVA
jgi:hypothetical protein